MVSRLQVVHGAAFPPRNRSSTRHRVTKTCTRTILCVVNKLLAPSSCCIVYVLDGIKFQAKLRVSVSSWVRQRMFCSAEQTCSQSPSSPGSQAGCKTSLTPAVYVYLNPVPLCLTRTTTLQSGPLGPFVTIAPSPVGEIPHISESLLHTIGEGIDPACPTSVTYALIYPPHHLEISYQWSAFITVLRHPSFGRRSWRVAP